MRISVAMATYNGEKYLREQMDSILANLSADDEIVVSDDGSDDTTWAILEEYQSKSEIPIRLVKGPKMGVISNFERALIACKGDYIFLADQDDVWAPDKVEKVMKAFRDHVQLVMHDAVVYNESMNTVLMESYFEYRHSKPGVWANLMKNSYMGCCMAFRRELVRQILPIPTNIQMHDQWIGVISDYFYGKSVLLDEKLLSYRRHNSAITDFKRNSLPKMIKNRCIFATQFIKRIKG